MPVKSFVMFCHRPTGARTNTGKSSVVSTFIDNDYDDNNDVGYNYDVVNNYVCKQQLLVVHRVQNSRQCLGSSRKQT